MKQPAFLDSLLSFAAGFRVDFLVTVTPLPSSAPTFASPFHYQLNFELKK